MNDAYFGIWFEKSGWWAPFGDMIFRTRSLKIAFAQLRVLKARNKGRTPEANAEVELDEWYDVPRVAEIGSGGRPQHFYQVPGIFPGTAGQPCSWPADEGERNGL